MEVSYSQLSIAGPARDHNEDYVLFWQPSSAAEHRSRGAVAIIADGVGGHGGGEIASRLAVETALEAFLDAPLDTAPSQLLWRMFNAANVAVYDAATSVATLRRMATTLTISLFRNAEVFIGHVGDCRVYLVQDGRLRRLTNDHSYSGVQLKLGLITVQEAANSDLRSVLTRSVGPDPFIRADIHHLPVRKGDILLQCCDGLYCCLNEGEMYDIVTKKPPTEACRELIALAERREAGDNLSVQVVRIDGVERLTYYRGLPIYRKVPDVAMGHEVQVGQLLDNRFQIDDLISRSGMASIFKATDTKNNRTVAVKVPFMRYEADPGFFSRFKREEDIGRVLNHPYILHIEPIDPEERSRPYIVMEYLEGQTLGQLMRSVRPLPISDALRIASRICEALDYMHGHDIVHRDLKPDNIMICNDGSIRIMDFGIAKAQGSRRLTFGGFQPAMGTPDYMAPEQIKGKRGDARTDIYSLGAMLYEMVTGNPPFEGANPLAIMNARLHADPIAPRKHNPDITPQVEEIILHAMARQPADRYSSARLMKDELDRPDSVQVTDRASRLQAVVPWKTHWTRSRLVLLAILLPILAWAVFYLLTHLRWKP